MPEQVDLTQFEPDSFTLSGLRSELSESKNYSLDGVTITYVVSSPTTFSHSWTFDDVSSMEEYMEELEDTEKAAMNRLENNFWNTDDEYSKNEVSLEPEEVPDEIDRFKDKKKSVGPLEDAVQKTEQVYNKSGDRGRNISIASKMDNSSSNLDEYMDNIQKVEKNLDFEDNVEDAWDEGRQRTAGDVEWYNEEGQVVRTLIFTNKVIHQIGGAQGQQLEFDNKDRGKEFYEENKLA